MHNAVGCYLSTQNYKNIKILRIITTCQAESGETKDVASFQGGMLKFK